MKRNITVARGKFYLEFLSVQIFLEFFENGNIHKNYVEKLEVNYEQELSSFKILR